MPVPLMVAVRVVMIVVVAMQSVAAATMAMIVARLGNSRQAGGADAQRQRRGHDEPGGFRPNAEHGPFSNISSAFCAYVVRITIRLDQPSERICV
jgi:hypothetical protein